MSDAALSVLVLAWDEAAPTLRTVVDAAPAVGSLLVLLPPQRPAPLAAAVPVLPSTPPQAEALSPTPAAPATTAAPAAAAPAAVSPALPEPVVAAAAAGAAPRATAPAEASSAAPPLPPVPAPLLAAAPVAPVSVRAPQPAPPPAVRLLHLADNPLVLLSHVSGGRVPAAPYLGATPPAAGPAERTVPTAPAAFLPQSPAQLEELALPEPALGPRLPPAPAAPAAPLGLAQVAEPPVAVAEATLVAAAATSSPAETSNTEAAAAEAPAPAERAADDNVPALADAAFRADELLDPNPMQELQAAPPDAPAATPADSPVLRDALPAAHGPFGLRIPERLPVLADPTSLPTRPPEPGEDKPLPDEPPPPAVPYSAPDLNTQVIRYARQAVQAALAEGPFGTIYAPAWPTWLAALELRQRSGRPLVLHLAALAAGRQPADTAAGWPAEIQRQALRQADLVLVETYSLARRLRRELGLDAKLVRVVPAGDAAAIARALRRARRP